VEKLLYADVFYSKIYGILKNIGIDFDVPLIKRIVLENDKKLGKTFIRIK
jgi:hypothetical protein